MKTKNKKSGFTLVELMIVAAIIAILAAIIIPLLTANRDRAVAADGQNLLGTAATALKVYYAKTGTTPTMALVEADDPLLATLAAGDQGGVFQHLEMAGNGRGRDREGLAQFAHCGFACGQAGQDGSAGGVGQGGEGGVETLHNK